jgi:hypothetical protein
LRLGSRLSSEPSGRWRRGRGVKVTSVGLIKALSSEPSGFLKPKSGIEDVVPGKSPA